MNNGQKTLIAVVVVVVVLLLGVGAYFFADYSEAEPIEYVGTVLQDGAKLGLVVPAYTYEKGIQDISDLNGNESLFESEIIGIDAGAGIMRITENDVMPHYGLDGYELTKSSDAAMMTSLRQAIDAEEDIVVTLWDPHWAFGAYELKYLNDPDKVFGEAESIESWSRPGFSEDEPAAAAVLANYTYTLEDFSDLLNAIQQNESATRAQVVEWWAANNSDLIGEWVGDVEYEEGRGQLTVGLVDWACAQASSHMIEYILEEYVGYNVTLQMSQAGVMYQGLSQGDIDFITTAWVPLTHASYMEEYA